MSTLCKTFDNDFEARRAVEALRSAGVPGRGIRVLAARRIHDIRREPVGSFAGVVGPDAPVGSFDDVPHLRRQGTGAFAGEADRQRQGSFGDADLRQALVLAEVGDVPPADARARFDDVPHAA
jgi:hypothetical protein